jgi:DNA-binding NtrC family response regulator
MRALFLDDNDERWAAMQVKRPEGVDIVRVSTAAQAIAVLKYDTFDIVCLDHDLAPEQIMTRDFRQDGTGMEVVRHILAMRLKIPLIIVHTWNPAAGARMLHDLAEAGYRVIREVFDPGRLAEIMNWEMAFGVPRA